MTPSGSRTALSQRRLWSRRRRDYLRGSAAAIAAAIAAAAITAAAVALWTWSWSIGRRIRTPPSPELVNNAVEVGGDLPENIAA